MAGIWYRVGTVAVTAGSTKIVGTGSTWRSGVHKPDKGHIFWGPDGRAYEVDYVESDTVLHLVTAYAGGSATGQAYSIVISITGQVPAFSRELSAFVAYHQGQMDGWQSLLTGTGNVTLTAPDGTKITVPSISAIGNAVPAHEVKVNAHPISGVTGLQSALDGKALKTGGTISDLRREGQSYGAIVAKVNIPLPQNTTDTSNNAIAVRIVSGWSDTMVRFRLIIRDYVNKHRQADITFSGYAYATGQDWFNDASIASVTGQGAMGWRVFTSKDTNGYPAIYFYNSNGFDDYCTVEIVDDVSRGTQPVYEFFRSAGFVGTEVPISRHYHTNNIVGTVSQSSGVPTGAIIERGSNANGEYVKFADGTMICIVIDKLLTNIAFPNAVGNLWQSDAITSTYPATFASGMVRASTAVKYSGGTTRPLVAAGDYSATSIFTLLHTSVQAASFTGALYSFAVGRWY